LQKLSIPFSFDHLYHFNKHSFNSYHPILVDFAPNRHLQRPFAIYSVNPASTMDFYLPHVFSQAPSHPVAGEAKAAKGFSSLHIRGTFN
jgi:hypothetical protein